MIKISGGPLPTTRYPTAPSLVWAIRTGADTTEPVPGAFAGAEPHAPSAKDISTAGRPRAIACRNARPPPATHMRLFVPLAAVLPGLPALLGRQFAVVVVHVLGRAVGRARQRSRSEPNDAGEAVDGEGNCGEEQENLPPRHVNHHDSICITRPVLHSFPYPAEPDETWPGAGIGGPMRSCYIRDPLARLRACFRLVLSRHWLGESGSRLPPPVRTAHGGGIRADRRVAGGSVARRGPLPGSFPGPAPRANRASRGRPASAARGARGHRNPVRPDRQAPPGAGRTRRLPGRTGGGLPAAGYRPAAGRRPRLAGRDLPSGSGAAARWRRGTRAGTGNGRALREPRAVL